MDRVLKKDINSWENKFYVYVHTFPNGKKYVGISNQPSWHRWGGQGQAYKGQVVYNAIKKYGWENVKHKIYDWNISQRVAEALEKRLIIDYKSTIKENGYNIALGGNHRGKFSIETIEKIRKANIGRKFSEETKEKIRQANFNRSEESYKKFRWYAKNKPQWVRDKISKSLTGKKQSEETKTKRILKLKEGKMSPETIQHMTYAQNHRSKEWEEKRLMNIPKRAIEQYDLNGNFIADFKSAIEASKIYNYSFSSIYRTLRGERKTYKNYFWRYKK